MSLQKKVDLVRKEMKLREDESGKFRKRTLKEKFWDWINTSRFVLAITMLTIGSAWTFNYLEGSKLYEEITGRRIIQISNEIQSEQKVALLGSLAKAATVAEENQEVQANSKKPMEEAQPSSYQGIRKAIYQLESSSGTKGTDQQCHSKGLHNGYGYIPFSCYESDEETGKLVDKWIQKKQSDGLTTAQLLCLYNTGDASDDCEYYQDYLKIGA